MFGLKKLFQPPPVEGYWFKCAFGGHVSLQRTPPKRLAFFSPTLGEWSYNTNICDTCIESRLPPKEKNE